MTGCRSAYERELAWVEVAPCDDRLMTYEPGALAEKVVSSPSRLSRGNMARSFRSVSISMMAVVTGVSLTAVDLSWARPW